MGEAIIQQQIRQPRTIPELSGQPLPAEQHRMSGTSHRIHALKPLSFTGRPVLPDAPILLQCGGCISALITCQPKNYLALFIVVRKYHIFGCQQNASPHQYAFFKNQKIQHSALRKFYTSTAKC
jgi:hypothetical protein